MHAHTLNVSPTPVHSQWDTCGLGYCQIQPISALKKRTRAARHQVPRTRGPSCPSFSVLAAGRQPPATGHQPPAHWSLATRHQPPAHWPPANGYRLGGSPAHGHTGQPALRPAATCHGSLAHDSSLRPPARRPPPHCLTSRRPQRGHGLTAKGLGSPEPLQPYNPKPQQPCNPEPRQPCIPDPQRPCNPHPPRPCSPEPRQPCYQVPQQPCNPNHANSATLNRNILATLKRGNLATQSRSPATLNRNNVATLSHDNLAALSHDNIA